jgi:hypothetical protein
MEQATEQAMEGIMERLLAAIRTNVVKIEANNKKPGVLRGTLVSRMDDHQAETEANHEEWITAIKASQERMEALMDVSLEITESCLEKIEADQGKVEIKMEACLEVRKWMLSRHWRTEPGTVSVLHGVKVTVKKKRRSRREDARARNSTMY